MITRSRSTMPAPQLHDVLESVKTHEFNGAVIRSVERNGQTWLVFSDVCKALGYKNPNHEHKRIANSQKLYADIGLKNSLAMCVSCYGLILFLRLSQKPLAKELLHWISCEFPKEGYCQ